MNKTKDHQGRRVSATKDGITIVTSVRLNARARVHACSACVSLRTSATLGTAAAAAAAARACFHWQVIRLHQVRQQTPDFGAEVHLHALLALQLLRARRLRRRTQHSRHHNLRRRDGHLQTVLAAMLLLLGEFQMGRHAATTSTSTGACCYRGLGRGDVCVGDQFAHQLGVVFNFPHLERLAALEVIRLQLLKVGHHPALAVPHQKQLPWW